MLVLFQPQVLDITSPCYHSPLGRSVLVSNSFALEAPIFDHNKVSETRLCCEAGAQVEEQETEGRSQKGAGVIEQDWIDQKKINKKKFLSIRRNRQ